MKRVHEPIVTRVPGDATAQSNGFRARISTTRTHTVLGPHRWLVNGDVAVSEVRAGPQQYFIIRHGPGFCFAWANGQPGTCIERRLPSLLYESVPPPTLRLCRISTANFSPNTNTVACACTGGKKGIADLSTIRRLLSPCIFASLWTTAIESLAMLILLVSSMGEMLRPDAE